MLQAIFFDNIGKLLRERDILLMRKNILIFGHSDATQFVDIYNQYTQIFDKAAYKVTVALLTGKPTDDVKQRLIAEEVIFLETSKKSIRGLKIKPIKQLRALCKEKQFEIVICHRYKPSYIMMWVAQCCNIGALIFVMHELRTMSSINRRLLIATLQRKNMIFAGVSNAVRDDMRKDLWFIPKERVVTLYNTLDVAASQSVLFPRHEARAKLNLADDAIVFGNIARLSHNKDQHTLIHAFSLIKPYCPKAKLIIMGDGELEKILREQIQQDGLQLDVILTGFLPAAYRYMYAFDCLVLSSIQEAFGRVLIEAMIANVPVIATRVNGIPEVMGNTGILIDPRNAMQLAEAMKRIDALSPEERHTFGKAGHARVQQYFSIPAFYQQFWQLPVLNALKEHA